MFAYALTIFLGAFLLFQVQPLIGKYILPWFGGGPGVWTTCMLFFQILLLGGYAYAHLLSQKLKPRVQAIVHITLLVVAVALLPITPSDSWKPDGQGNPVFQILLLLTVSLGLPYFVLSSTGPLMQQWFSRTNPGASPYRLYALSNVGSLLALVSYPFYFETHFTRIAQARMWGVGLVLFVAVCGWCAFKLWKTNAPDNLAAAPVGSTDAPAPVPIVNRFLWLALPACASVLLLAVTNKLCQDVAVIPFLWVLPLALYLLSFVICFDSPRWYVREFFVPALMVSLAALCWVMFKGVDAPIRWQVGIYAGVLFLCCMVCHGELYRLRPHPRYLTSFYLMIAAGGALGGVLVAVIAPLVFTDYYELNWGLAFCVALIVTVFFLETHSKSSSKWMWLGITLTLIAIAGVHYALANLEMIKGLVGFNAETKRGLLTTQIAFGCLWAVLLACWIIWGRFKAFRYWRLLTCVWLLLGGLAMTTAMRYQERGESSGQEIVSRSRNFYGTLKVCEYRKDEPEYHYFLLQHGRITHGIQFVNSEKAMIPTSYYARGSGVEMAVRALPQGPRRIGVVGLGTGSMAVFGRAGDNVHIYEINRDVERVATSRFSYLSKCPAKVEVSMGDARLSMEREKPQEFDLLALDAFSSDAIPVHLLTEEAFTLYDRNVKTNGIIAVHISNRYLNLEPVVANIARAHNYKMAIISFEESSDEFDEESEWWIYSSTWVLLTHNQEIINSAEIVNATSPGKTNKVEIPLWTDDFASVFQILQ